MVVGVFLCVCIFSFQIKIMGYTVMLTSVRSQGMCEVTLTEPTDSVTHWAPLLTNTAKEELGSKCFSFQGSLH